MKSLWKILFIVGISLMGTSCETTEGAGTGIDSQLSHPSLLPDLEILQSVNFLVPSPDLNTENQFMALTGISSINGNNLTQWLDDRVNYVIGSIGWDDYQARITQMNSYAASDPLLIMQNVGTTVYSIGLDYDTIFKFAVNLNPRVDITVTTPRVGIIAVEEGLFDPSFEPSSNPESVANSLNRLAVLFHEARHSDGANINGNLGFYHSDCPAGHLYAGQPACDSCTNGAYPIGAAFLKLAVEACATCTNSEKNQLLLLQADQSNRLISGAASCNPQPEALFSGPTGMIFEEY